VLVEGYGRWFDVEAMHNEYGWLDSVDVEAMTGVEMDYVCEVRIYGITN